MGFWKIFIYSNLQQIKFRYDNASGKSNAMRFLFWNVFSITQPENILIQLMHPENSVHIDFLIVKVFGNFYKF